ncbi:hypothetical protein [Streptomyces liliifuscus]|uniref:Uncharacterized protein n=1 Tax=Streptomyces liliifuscus TaxID=2797636 RepID=A0A7T7RFW9_9ACTN|nr:hypothetical protein [Streptomyces liliifuscus]QQM45106.1 hypothetical protein JEQ17_40725 [Streptomyces liliifuscus]
MKPFQSPPPPITRADVPLATVQQQIADLVARQNEQRAEESAARLRSFFDGTNTTTKEAS